MTAAATATAEIERNLKPGNQESIGCRSRPSGNKYQPSSASNGHSVGYEAAESLENHPSNIFVSKARRQFFLEHSDRLATDPSCNPCRNKSSVRTTSEYGTAGDSDSAEHSRRSPDNMSVFGAGRVATSCPQSPETKGAAGKNGAFSSPSSSSSAASLTFSSGASLGCCSDPRSAYTEDILKVLEEDGLILQVQACPRDNLLPLPIPISDRRASADYNVIELSRQYRKKELSQLRSSSDRFQHISDIHRLQQMLASTDDEDKRRAIRQRLVELRNQNKENAQRNGQRARSLSTREMVTHNEGSPVKDAAMLGGIASLTVSPFSGTARSSPTSSPANGCKGGTPTGYTKIVARTPAEIKAALLLWCQIKTRGYGGVRITNFTRSWSDGLAFCALIHHFFPDSFDFSKLDAKNRRENFELSFRVSEEMAGIVPLLDVDDMIAMGDNPEYKCVYTYIQSMYRSLHELER